MKGYRQKIDNSALNQLFECSRLFPGTWGEGDRTVSGLVFDNPEGRLEKLVVEYEAKKQLLGGVFSLIFSGESRSQFSEDGDAEMFYRGRFIKGEAYFKGDEQSGLCETLNGNKELIALLTNLDLLTMKVSSHEGKLMITLSPLGGAYTYTVFPPVKYGGILPQGDLDKINRVMALIADSFFDEKLAVGAE